MEDGTTQSIVGSVLQPHSPCGYSKSPFPHSLFFCLNRETTMAIIPFPEPCFLEHSNQKTIRMIWSFWILLITSFCNKNLSSLQYVVKREKAQRTSTGVPKCMAEGQHLQGASRLTDWSQMGPPSLGVLSCRQFPFQGRGNERSRARKIDDFSLHFNANGYSFQILATALANSFAFGFGF